MMSNRLLLLSFAGCINQNSWPVGTSAAAISKDPIQQASWERSVTSAVNKWNDSLVSIGCSEFLIVDTLEYSDRKIILEPMKNQPNSTTIGEFDGNSIVVYGDSGELKMPVLLHEIGHAIGLDHNNRKTSVMLKSPVRFEPDAQDLIDASKLIGCGE